MDQEKETKRQAERCRALAQRIVRELTQYTAENSFTDEWEGPAFYHMEVAQPNQQWAFVSPIFFE